MWTATDERENQYLLGSSTTGFSGLIIQSWSHVHVRNAKDI